MHIKCIMLESSQSHPPNPESVEKFVFHETGLWC